MASEVLLFSSISAKCPGGCKNGGTCAGPDRCHCSQGFSGRNCKTVLCDPPCRVANIVLFQQRLSNALTFVAERRKVQAETGSPEKLRSWSPRRRRLPKKEGDQVHHGLQVQDGVLRQPVPAPVVVTGVPFCVLKGGGGLCTQRSQRRSAVELVHKRFFNITFLGTVGRRRENYWSAGDSTFVRVYAVYAGNGRNEGRRNCAYVRACLCLLVWKYIAPGGDAKLAVLSYLVNCGGGGSAISGGGGGKGKQHQR